MCVSEVYHFVSVVTRRGVVFPRGCSVLQWCWVGLFLLYGMAGWRLIPCGCDIGLL